MDDAALQEMLWQPRGRFEKGASTQHTDMLIPQDGKTLKQHAPNSSHVGYPSMSPAMVMLVADPHTRLGFFSTGGS